MKSALVEIGRRQDARGWVPATAGNLSCRAEDGTVWITGSGVHKGRFTEADLVRVDLQGEVLEGVRRPSAETSLHLAVYRTHPGAQACLHVHTVAAALVCRLAQGDRLDLPPLEIVKAFGIWEQDPSVHVPVFANLLSVPAIAQQVEAAFSHAAPRVPGFLIAQHGLTAWGADLERADYALEAFEFLFRAMHDARAARLD